MAPVVGSREHLQVEVAGRHPSTIHLIGLFAWSHLPPDLCDISQPCGTLALGMVRTLPDGQELSAGLRKLVEAKDCFVREAVSHL